MLEDAPELTRWWFPSAAAAHFRRCDRGKALKPGIKVIGVEASFIRR